MQTADVPLGFFAAPEGGPHAGLVMIHDVWGLTDHARDLAGRFAGEGFATLAVDFYRREPEVKIEDPGAWMRGLSDPQVLEDVAAGRAFLADRAECRGRRVGVVGFCMGGMYALMAGCSVPGFAATVPFYGLLSHRHGLLHDPAGLDPERKPREPLAMASELRCPLLGFWGDADEHVALEDVRALERELARAPAPAEIVIVPGAGHAFMNDTRPGAYRPDDAAAAWQRTVAFLREHLGD